MVGGVRVAAPMIVPAAVKAPFTSREIYTSSDVFGELSTKARFMSAPLSTIAFCSL
jgi:hypothetical protein